MIGGPFAGAAVTAIESALGLPATGDKEAALKAVAGASPEQLLALKAEDNRHAEATEQLGIPDEAHHSVSGRWSSVLNLVRQRLGVTATPCRTDGRGIGETGLFHRIVKGPSIGELRATC